MKIKLVCDAKKYFELKKELESRDIEVVDDAELVLTDTSSKVFGLRLTSKGETYIVNEEDIYAFESFDHDIFVYLKDKQILINTPLKTIIKSLSNNFIQINQSTIINIKYIKKIKSEINYRFNVLLENNSKYYVTKTYYFKFIEHMDL